MTDNPWYAHNSTHFHTRSWQQKNWAKISCIISHFFVFQIKPQVDGDERVHKDDRMLNSPQKINFQLLVLLFRFKKKPTHIQDGKFELLRNQRQNVKVSSIEWTIKKYQFIDRDIKYFVFKLLACTVKMATGYKFHSLEKAKACSLQKQNYNATLEWKFKLQR